MSIPPLREPRSPRPGTLAGPAACHRDFPVVYFSQRATETEEPDMSTTPASEATNFFEQEEQAHALFQKMMDRAGLPHPDAAEIQDSVVIDTTDDSAVGDSVHRYLAAWEQEKERFDY